MKIPFQISSIRLVRHSLGDGGRSMFARGFSMIELLVAMAITSIIMVTLFSLVGQTTTSYTQTQRAVNAVSQARAFIQFFDRELSTRLPGTPLVHEKKSAAGGPSSSERIAFVRALTADEFTDTDPGDLGTSIYYVAFSNDGSRGESPKLFRKSLGPKETQEKIIEAGNTPALPTVDPTKDETIIPNVLSFEATPMFRDTANGGLTEWANGSPQPPSVVELEITFIDDSSAQRFKTQAEWNRLATAPRDNELQLVRTFTRNIAIAK